MKQKLYKGHDLSPQEIEEIKKDRRADAIADALLAGLVVIAGAIILAFLTEILM